MADEVLDAGGVLHEDLVPPPLARRLEAVSRQRISLRMHRLLVTMVKRAEPTPGEEGAPSLGEDHVRCAREVSGAKVVAGARSATVRAVGRGAR